MYLVCFHTIPISFFFNLKNFFYFLVYKALLCFVISTTVLCDGDGQNPPLHGGQDSSFPCSPSFSDSANITQISTVAMVTLLATSKIILGNKSPLDCICIIHIPSTMALAHTYNLPLQLP